MDNDYLDFTSKVVTGGVLGAFISLMVTRGRERLKLTYDLHSELHNEGMSKVRRKTSQILKNHPDSKIGELDELVKDDSLSVWLLIRFYQRLSIAVKHNFVKRKLVPELFGQLFCYWYLNFFKNNFIEQYGDWDSAKQIKYLYDWLERNAKKEDFESWGRIAFNKEEAIQSTKV